MPFFVVQCKDIQSHMPSKSPFGLRPQRTEHTDKWLYISKAGIKWDKENDKT